MSRFLVALLAAVTIHFAAAAVAECFHKSKQIKCYECHSSRQEWCNDPFNFSMIHFVDDVDEVSKDCNGCCVKLVENWFSPTQSVRRTCTSQIQIKMFMVDIVCMLSGSGTGTMCFCGEDYCNVSNTLDGITFLNTLLLPLITFVFR